MEYGSDSSSGTTATTIYNAASQGAAIYNSASETMYECAAMDGEQAQRTVKRNSNWTEDETAYLMRLVNERKHIIKGKFGPGVTSKSKREAWHIISQKINASFPYSVRTADQCMKRWRNVIAKGKSQSARKKLLNGTGKRVFATSDDVAVKGISPSGIGAHDLVEYTERMEREVENAVVAAATAVTSKSSPTREQPPRAEGVQQMVIVPDLDALATHLNPTPPSQECVNPQAFSKMWEDSNQPQSRQKLIDETLKAMKEAWEAQKRPTLPRETCATFKNDITRTC